MSENIDAPINSSFDVQLDLQVNSVNKAICLELETSDIKFEFESKKEINYFYVENYKYNADSDVIYNQDTSILKQPNPIISNKFNTFYRKTKFKHSLFFISKSNWLYTESRT